MSDTSNLVDLVKEMGGSEVTDEMAATIVDEVIEEARGIQVQVATETGMIRLPVIPDRLAGEPCRCFDPDCTVPYGMCHCGCGKMTKPYGTTDHQKGLIKGEYGLSLHGHSYKHGTHEVAMPFLAVHRRQTAAQAKTNRNPKKKKPVDNALRRALLYEVYYKDTKDHDDHRSRLAAHDAAKIAGLDVTRYEALKLFKELTALGCMESDGPVFKRCILHPNTLSGTVTVVKPEPKPTASTPATHEDMITQVTSKQMADAIATAMWTRYEWALSEVGRCQEQVTALTAENDRLRALLGEQPIDATEVARRILTN